MANTDTHGWDTVVAVRLSALNVPIGRQTEGHRIEYSYTARSGAPAITLVIELDKWQVTDVYGPQITISGSIRTGNLVAATGTLVLDGALLTITANMILKRNAEGESRATPNATARSQNSSRWATVDISGRPDLTFQKAVAVRQVVESWLARPEGLKAWNDVFGNLGVRLADAVAQPSLAPKVVCLAGATLDGGDKAIGLLGRTLDADITGNSVALSSGIIPNGHVASLMLSPSCFLRAFLMPALPHVFGTKPENAGTDFSLINGNAVVNAVPIDFQVSTGDGKTHVARIAPNNFVAEMEGEQLAIRIEQMTLTVDASTVFGKVNLITVSMKMVEYLSASIVTPADKPDHPVLILSQIGDVIVEHDDEQSLILIGGELLVGLVLGVASVLVTKFVPAGLAGRGLSMIAARIWTAILAVLIQGLGKLVEEIPAIMTRLERVDLAQMPNFQTAIDGAATAIDWPLPMNATLDTVAFNDGLLCGLKLEPA